MFDKKDFPSEKDIQEEVSNLFNYIKSGIKQGLSKDTVFLKAVGRVLGIKISVIFLP